MSKVYASVHAALRPGGILCCVIKDYVRAGQRVPLCDQTLALLRHVGFTPVERVHAMLVKETRTPGLFSEVIKTVARKSFFRRLFEAKLPPDSDCRIDWEVVLFVRKQETKENA